MQGFRYPLLFFAATLSLTAIFSWIYYGKEVKQPAPPAPVVSKPLELPKQKPEPIEAIQEPSKADEPQSLEEALEGAGMGVVTVDPAKLLDQIGAALEAGDLATAGRLIGSGALTPEAKKRLIELSSQGVRLRRPHPVQEVGELKLNERARWALWLEGLEVGRDRILFDLQRRGDGWIVEQLILPPGRDEPVPKAVVVDALGIADAFLQAALKQDFELAKEFVDSSVVSDAKIAGLCILFEEGKYRLRPEKPLRAMFQRDDVAGYVAYVQATDGSEAAEFSLVMGQTAPPNWRVTDLNLDRLLADYARRVAGGDVYFTPLVKNPKGGDTLVLYFEFDEDTLTERTARQIEIVAHLLKTDPGKKLTISGHTDALGTEEYNHQLSQRRAATVKKYLVEAGVAESQIITHGEGQSQPRRPNFTESGEDNPEGRRANRRTEIYLDF